MNTAEAIEILRLRYPMEKGKWANIVEFQGIDFMAVGLWKSLAFDVYGFEIKVSRADWLRELKSPQKAENGMAMCDFWYLAAPPGVLKDLSELPENWGYVELRDRPVVKHWAPRLRGDFPARGYTSRDGVRRPVRAYWDKAAFAMMARRYVYAQADRDALSLCVEAGEQEALDEAASRTGRWTSKRRAAQASRRRSAQRRRQQSSSSNKTPNSTPKSATP